MKNNYEQLSKINDPAEWLDAYAKACAKSNKEQVTCKIICWGVAPAVIIGAVVLSALIIF